MRIPVHFPGGVSVAARVGTHVVVTDQPTAAGGGATAPAPFDLFLASLATCAGFYAVRFCQTRQLDAAGLGLEMETASEGHGITHVTFHLRLPAGFPERYREAIARAIDQCAVKRHLDNPPRFETVITSAEEAKPAPRPADIPSERSLEPVPGRK
ncbi:MAG: osmotically inducible protein OsmC [Thermoanaerobaculia bacterium]|nr:MAG: osmotically inducible protein OsmC [Thermoanaerobaculia bacterium]